MNFQRNPVVTQLESRVELYFQTAHSSTRKKEQDEDEQEAEDEDGTSQCLSM